MKKKETRQIFPIKCPECGENSFWNKDFTLARDWQTYSKEMAEADCRLLGFDCKMPTTQTRIVSKYPSTMSNSLIEHILTKIIKGI